MRWDRLFGDLESQYAQLRDAELYGEVAERTRSESAALTLQDRLRGAVGHELALDLSGGSVRGTIQRVRSVFLLVETGAGEEWVIPATAVVAVHRPGRWSARPAGAIESRLGLASALRGVARDRSPVLVHCLGDDPTQSPPTGTIDRVGADFLEMAEHHLDASRRSANVYNVRLVPFTAVVAVRRR